MKGRLVVDYPTTYNKEVWKEKAGKLKTIILGTKGTILDPMISSDRGI